ncbi:MAG TPA: hypothetical protein VFF85_02920 [Microbacterium sp.]|nr:hypothetical protein [Microbacterium sp.]
MKRIVMSFGAFLTGDEIADAVNRYSLALAKAHETEIIEIPYRATIDRVDRIELRVGWLVDIGIVHQGEDGRELLEPETVRHLHDTADALEHVGSVGEHSSRSWTRWEYDL